MSGMVGAGDFIPWNGGCLLIGRALSVAPMHSHYAIQIAFGSERGIRFSPSQREAAREYDGVMISSRQPHLMDATGVGIVAVLLVEPETREGRALSERYRDRGITPLAADAVASVRQSLLTTWQAQGNAPVTAMAAQKVIDTLAGGLQPVVVPDERILKAIVYINSNLNTNLKLKKVASEVFRPVARHLFVAQTGTALDLTSSGDVFARGW
jgi:hypothetical protein